MSSKRLYLCGLLLLGLTRTFSSLADIQYAGVNLSGAEFGQQNLPGTFGSDYTWPTSAEISYYKSKGMNFIRLPFRWERLQHTNSAVLDPTELGRMNTFVTNATSQGMYVLLDPHNFMRYYPVPRGSYETATTGLVGDYSGSTVSNSDFANFWSQVAGIYKTNSHVFFGLNNEPDSMQEASLVTSENMAIAAIRATGATNLIFVPGNGYTGAWTWLNSNGSYGAANSVAMLGIVDSGSNYVFEAHQYLDQDYSGSHTNIGYTYSTNIDDIQTNIFVPDPNVGWQRLTNFTAWARSNHFKGFLGEFAVDDSMIGTNSWQIGGAALTNMLSYIQTNSDVWLGWSWWGGGPWWGSTSLFLIDPANIGSSNPTDRPVMGIIKHFFPLPIPTLQLANGNKFQFIAPQGFVYQPQFSTNLASAGWTNYGTSFMGNGVTTNIAMQVGPGSQGFYRVQASHAP